MNDFKAYPKIENISKLYMTITQKIHGTNAQIYIYEHISLSEESELKIVAGSRTRWLTADDDNYGFAKWVENNSEELIKVLGVGRHYGEWCGKGINTGEGLPVKMFVLFDWWTYKDHAFKPFISEKLHIRIVPVLYTGHFSYEEINNAMNLLKTEGSRLTPVGWFMKPEGIVIDINGVKYKKVFDPEETKWNRSDAPKIKHINVDVSHLLQPTRLEKLLSRDERYRREYPNNMKEIFSDYYKDLVLEGCIIIEGQDVKALTRALGSELYRFIKYHMENPNGTA